MSDEFRTGNQKLWDEWTAIHIHSDFYDLESFKAGRCTLKSIEIEEIGDVTGKSLLHMQCHFGLDTLSWARRGAEVTGVDLSERAISFARQLSNELNIPANFVHSDIYELPGLLDDEFDIVFTSYGVLAWLPDLARWGGVIGHFLKPGGTFYIVEFHPYFYVFDDSDDVEELRVAYPYFETKEPLEIPVRGSYADRSAQVGQAVAYEWVHSMSEILNSLTSARLRIEFLHEFPYSVHPQVPALMAEGKDGWWRLKDARLDLPLMFSLKTVKPR